MSQEKNLELLLMPILQDTQAVKFCVDIYMICQFWDDLIDRDKELTDSYINSAMYGIIFNIYDNNFFRANEFELKPIMKSAVFKWFSANTFEDNKEHLDKSYMLRAGIYDVFAHCLYIIKGKDSDFSEIYKLYGEDLEEFKKEILCQNQ